MPDGGRGEGAGTGTVEPGTSEELRGQSRAGLVKVPSDRGLKTLPFTNTLEYAISEVPGGKRTFIGYARLVDDERVKAFVQKWDGLMPAQRRRTSLTDICTSLDLDPKDVLKEVVGVCYEINSDLSNLIAAVMHPKVTKATVKYALKENGFKDRELLHTHGKFISDKSGQTFNLTANSSANAGAAAKSTVQGDDSGLPDFEESSIKNIKTIRGDE